MRKFITNRDQLKVMFPNVMFPKPVSVRPAVANQNEKTLKTIKNLLKKSTAAKTTGLASRRKVEKELHILWSKVVRGRDGYVCQWCHSAPNQSNHAHHIVARSICNRHGYFAVENGVTLCFRCHIIRLKSEVDEYISWRDEWLKTQFITYQTLKERYTSRCKVSVSDLQLIKIALEQELKRYGSNTVGY